MRNLQGKHPLDSTLVAHFLFYREPYDDDALAFTDGNYLRMRRTTEIIAHWDGDVVVMGGNTRKAAKARQDQVVRYAQEIGVPVRVGGWAKNPRGRAA